MRILSLGAGVQSTALALMAASGELDPPDCAIFADTGWEPSEVYSHLARLEKALPFPVCRVRHGNIRLDLERKPFLPIPWFQLSPDGKRGMGRRQCSREYKIDPIAKKARELLGYRPRQRIPTGLCQMWIGITTDEASRMKPSWYPWIENRWPLIDARVSRADCVAWLKARGWAPRRSACIGCPFRSNAEWRSLSPDDFADACEVDRIIRGPDRGGYLQFAHPARIPLAEVDLSTAEERGQFSLWDNECEGICGV